VFCSFESSSDNFVRIISDLKIAINQLLVVVRENSLGRLQIEKDGCAAEKRFEISATVAGYQSAQSGNEPTLSTRPFE